MDHPCVAAFDEIISRMRSAQFDAPVVIEQEIVPQVFFSADLEQGNVEITPLERDGALLNISVTVTGQPRWFVLGFRLGTGSFSSGDTIGLIAEVRASEAPVSKPFIRSLWPEQYHDTAFAEPLEIGVDPQPTVLLHTIAQEDPLTYGETRQNLLVPLPMRDFTLCLHDLRLLHLSHELGLSARPLSLGGLTV